MKGLHLLFIIVFLAAQPLFGEDQKGKDGPALYQSGDYAAAAAWYLSRSSGNRDLNYYNAARCFHQDYLDNHDTDSLDRAVDGYYRVLELNPQMKEALKNLELARKEQEKNQSEQSSGNQGQQGQDQQNQDQTDRTSGEQSLADLAEQQKELSESETSEDSRQKQESLKQQTEESVKNSESREQKEALEKAVEKQREALEMMKNGQDQDAREAQKSAAEYLQKASAPDGGEQNPLSQDLQSLLNQEQNRKRDNQDSDEFIQVERNW